MTKFLLSLLLMAVPLAAQSSGSADADYAAFDALLKTRPPGTEKEMGSAEYLTWFDQHRQKLSAAGLAVFAAHPTDPRRWDLVLKVSQQKPFFATSFGPDVATKGLSAAVVDEAAKLAWEQKLSALKQQMLESADAPAANRESVEWERFAADFRATSAAKAKGQPYDYSGFRSRFEAHAAKYAALDVVAARAGDYLGALEAQLPGSTEEIWRGLQSASNAALQKRATERLQFIDLMKRPLDIAFTAIDGRDVDLKNLRGKVVLIDFWATWCGPCIAELPNVKRVYQAYHDKGFEIVGITLENARLAPNDTAEQTAAKLAAAKQVLAEFVAKENMPWPQQFDGKFWKNDISTRFAINGIPAMFLLDQEGRVVSTNARGENLEREVKRLLKL